MALVRASPLLAVLVFSAVACKEDARSSDAPEATDAAAQATATGNGPAASPAREPALTVAKPKPFAAAGELGTLPEGVGIAVGERAPDFELPSVEGGKVRLSELLERSEVLLVFYRGGW